MTDYRFEEEETDRLTQAPHETRRVSLFESALMGVGIGVGVALVMIVLGWIR